MPVFTRTPVKPELYNLWVLAKMCLGGWVKGKSKESGFVDTVYIFLILLNIIISSSKTNNKS